MPIKWENYGTTVYDAIDSLKRYDVGIGINSSGWRHGIRDVYPILGFLRAAWEAEVDKVVVGSDCHRVEDLGVNTVKAARRLKQAGYNHFCVFDRNVRFNVFTAKGNEILMEIHGETLCFPWCFSL